MMIFMKGHDVSGFFYRKIMNKSKCQQKSDTSKTSFPKISVSQLKFNPIGIQINKTNYHLLTPP